MTKNLVEQQEQMCTKPSPWKQTKTQNTMAWSTNTGQKRGTKKNTVRFDTPKNTTLKKVNTRAGQRIPKKKQERECAHKT